MAFLDFVVNGFAPVQRAMEEAQRAQRADIRAYVVSQATEVIQGLQQRTPPDQRNKIDYAFFVEEKPNLVTADVILRQDQDAGPLKFAVVGTAPHIIRGRPLRWYDKQGVPHFAMFVMHPGIKPNPALTPKEDDLGFVADFVARRTGQK